MYRDAYPDYAQKLMRMESLFDGTMQDTYLFLYSDMSNCVCCDRIRPWELKHLLMGELASAWHISSLEEGFTF